MIKLGLNIWFSIINKTSFASTHGTSVDDDYTAWYITL